ncbi:aminopeptidase [Melghirimyces profundicolus]|uniref:Aminopeptidase n=1 Tax=Melghirimyces profundicolus TaxID=1242148 RepID=A0A2T6BQL5_9BACL|nr:aminopeptidase [Melghirimyces profundicolus]PTX58339.1 aminopeptidase [Melghirimyces profundicolus]
MRDPRVTDLARLLVNHSMEVKSGDKVLIDLFGERDELARALITEVYQAGGYPLVHLNNDALLRAQLLSTNEEHMDLMARHDLARMKEMDCYVAIRGRQNINELADVPSDKMKLYAERYNRVVHDERVNNTRWVVLRYPNPSMAQLAGTSTEAFEDFFYNVCTVDYKRMDKAMDPLVKRMEETEEVRIKGPGTDLTFSIQGLPAIKCAGKANIPDGEVFTAPVRESVNGVLTYNTASVYQGTKFENIRFEFRDGKIVKATANETEKLNKILDTDEGARYIGEFSLGINPDIHHPMLDTLFDEKINGSFHFTPGRAYEECDNGNRSAIHWDIVNIQRADYGGGEIYFDGELIRKDGLFTVPDLQPLNPENLRG